MSSAFFSDLQLGQRQIENECNSRQGVDLCSSRGDLTLISGIDNVAQAIINRLLTRKGELAVLGHPEYGSRLFQLIGEPNSARTRALAEMYIRECLAQDPRIEDITRFYISEQDRRSQDREILDIHLALKLVSSDPNEQETLNISVPVAL